MLRATTLLQMANLNKVMLIGHLGADPDVRSTTSGQQVASIRLATSESWTDKNGQRQERTEWHRIVAWGKLAELCGKYLEKGRLVYFEGKLQTREWDDNEGVKRYSTEIVAEKVQFLGAASGGSGSNTRPSQRDPFANTHGTDDDIPF